MAKSNPTTGSGYKSGEQCWQWRHGMARTREYKSWFAMTKRCLDPKYEAYQKYGGRGITVCERWLDFKNFYADMGPRPEGTSLDRIDNNKGYEPGNCRWATRLVQSRNQSVSLRYVFDGMVFHSQADLAKHLGVARTTISYWTKKPNCPFTVEKVYD